jgi:formylglycine-generating enzyme required for sulfatase activity
MKPSGVKDALTQTEIVNSLGMCFVHLPAGSYQMGAETPKDGIENGMDNALPQHQVNISTAFYMARHEVTQAQWVAVMGNNPSRNKGPAHPVENVSYVDAQVFIQRLNQREGTFKYRLPTEAEWEYAARAGTQTAWSCGDTPASLWRYAWVDADDDWMDRLPEEARPKSQEEFLDMAEARVSTHPVGSKLPNPWGLYDMHGNVEEWVADWYDPAYYARSPQTDPKGPKSAQARVTRGGSYGAIPRCARSAYRNNGFPTRTSPELGFRVAFTETTGGAWARKLKSFLSKIFKSHEPERPTQADAPRPAQLPQQLPKRLLSWPLRMGAGALFVMFAYVTGLMVLEGDRAWYGGVLPALLFGRYAQKGTLGDQFFSYVWKAFLAVVFIDVVLHEVLQ